MDPIRTLIVDDEPLARENLRIRLHDVNDFIVVGECANGRETLAAISEQKPDLLFIDIQMPDLNGFEVLERVPVEILPVIVFVTAFDRYALEAFRVHALDYLLKPFEDERFAETLQLSRERVAEARRAAREADPLYRLSGPAAVGGEFLRMASWKAAGHPVDRLVIKTRGRVFFLKTEDIDWIEANGDYSRLHTAQKSYLLRKTMNEMETRLLPAAFARTSRSAIVNLDHILDLVPIARGEFMIRLRGGGQIKLTRTYRHKLEKLLGDRL
jgi:two-component system LytT family response regulator